MCQAEPGRGVIYGSLRAERAQEIEKKKICVRLRCLPLHFDKRDMCGFYKGVST